MKVASYPNNINMYVWWECEKIGLMEWFDMKKNQHMLHMMLALGILLNDQSILMDIALVYTDFWKP